MKNNIIVIADDFTGANDTGVQLQKNGYDVDVVFEVPKQLNNKAIVLDTETRNSLNKKATEILDNFSKELFLQEFDIVYKKIDSTLRGNIGEELASIIKYYKPSKVVIAPGYPIINRKTINGVQYLNDIRLMETEITNDPLKPIFSDNIYEVISSNIEGEYTLYTRDDLYNSKKLTDSFIHIFDVEKDNDLDKVVKLCRNEKDILYVGSAGLANPLFKKEELPSLSIIGSISEISFLQMNYVEDYGYEVICMNINDIVSHKYEKYIKLIEEKLRENKDVILTATREKKDYQNTVETFNKLGIEDKTEISNLVKQSLTKITNIVLNKVKVSGLFLTGGDTAVEITKSLGSYGNKIQKEIYPGVVKGILQGGPLEGLTIVTKAGAFGDKETLLNSINNIKER